MSARILLSAVTLAVAVVGTASAATTSAQFLACQKAIESRNRSFANYVATKAGGCVDKTLPCSLASEIDAVDATACLASATNACSTVPGQVANQQTLAAGKIALACGLIPFDELQQFVGGLGFFNVVADCGALNVNALIGCILADTRCSSEKVVFHLNPRAQDALTTVGIAASFPCVAP